MGGLESYRAQGVVSFRHHILMTRNPPTQQDQRELALPLAVKLLLCLWMAAVIFVFILVFLPSKYLIIANSIDLQGLAMELKNWLQPNFNDLYIQF